MESILYQRIKELCKQRDITLSELAKAVGVSDTVFRTWKESSPSIDKVRRIAEYFHVSTVYLIGITDIPDSIDSIIQDDDFISLQRLRSGMSATDKKRMMKMIRLAFDKAYSDET